MYNERWQDALIFALNRFRMYRDQTTTKVFSCVSNLPSKSDTILFKLDVNVLKVKDVLNSLSINIRLRAEIAAKIDAIPKFSTFTSFV